MQWYLFRLIPARRSWLSPSPDGWHLQNKMVGLIPWVSKLWSVVAELSNILWCTVPCRCTKVVIWKIPVWCLTFQVYPRCVYINVQTSRICDSPFHLHSDTLAPTRAFERLVWGSKHGVSVSLEALSICVTRSSDLWQLAFFASHRFYFLTNLRVLFSCWDLLFW